MTPDPGPYVDEFEEALAERVGARSRVAFANGTAALHAAAAAAELGPGDVVVTSPLSFAASANCARYVGPRREFVDIDPDDPEPRSRSHPARLRRLGGGALRRPARRPHLALLHRPEWSSRTRPTPSAR